MLLTFSHRRLKRFKSIRKRCNFKSRTSPRPRLLPLPRSQKNLRNPKSKNKKRNGKADRLKRRQTPSPLPKSLPSAKKAKVPPHRRICNRRQRENTARLPLLNEKLFSRQQQQQNLHHKPVKPDNLHPRKRGTRHPYLPMVKMPRPLRRKRRKKIKCNRRRLRFKDP